MGRPRKTEEGSIKTMETPVIEAVEKPRKEPGIAAISAQLHNALQWPGTKLNCQTALNDSKARMQATSLKMWAMPIGLLAQCDGKQTIIPWANVCNWVPRERIE